MRLNYVFNFNYSFGKEESYFNYSLYNSSLISRFVLDVSGQIMQMTWLEDTNQWKLYWYQPSTKCEVYAYCGPNGICNDDSDSDGFCECLPGFEPRFPEYWKLLDISGGCVRKADLQCANGSHANGERDQFLLMSNARLPENALNLQASSAMDCESACLNNCSCPAYAYDKEKCWVWSGDLLNLQQLSDSETNGKDFHLKLAHSELNRRGKKKGMFI